MKESQHKQCNARFLTQELCDKIFLNTTGIFNHNQNALCLRVTMASKIMCLPLFDI